MPTIKTVIKENQPKVYERLMAIYLMPETRKYPKKHPSISIWDIKDAMRHNSYRRGRGGIKQVGWDE